MNPATLLMGYHHRGLQIAWEVQDERGAGVSSSAGSINLIVPRCRGGYRTNMARH